ncbi:ketosynthase chain-length factor [Streptomyces sp. NPDC014733]|uniref:ketosynthase chain-length factor n=1 Tax=Streptomyces sp. NPDC014733 TaxID=3364885 RepID=UPI0036FD8CD1
MSGRRTGAPAPDDAVITGLGVAAATGLGTEEHWNATVKGASGIGPIRRHDASGYPCRLAGEVPGFDPADHLSGRLLPQTDRMTQLALAASDWALADAGLDPATLDEYGMGVVTASASGGFEFAQKELQSLWSKGPRHVTAYQSFAWFYAVNSGQISIRHGLRGPSGVLVTGQAGGLDALAHARRQLRAGVPAMLTGGMEAPLSPWGLVSQLTSGRLSTCDDPARAYLPFDAAACGHVPGEGGALLVMERAEAARARGARVLGTFAGYCATFDPAPDTGRPPGLRRAIQGALDDAGTAPDAVDVVFADAAGVRAQDTAEAEALAAVFGDRPVPVTAPKTMTGRLASGGAALDVASALLAMRDAVVPPTPHVTAPAADAPAGLVRDTARRMPVRSALIVARGHGGFNAAAVLRAAG